MGCGVLAVVAAAVLTTVAAVVEAPCVALAPIPREQLSRRRNARRGQYPYLALVATMWGECSAAIVAPIALLGPSSCLPRGYPRNGRVDAGNNRFFNAWDFGDEPTQAKIIDKFIRAGPETPFADSLMLMKLLDPFQLTSYVKSIPMSPPVSPPVRALVVGYGMDSEEWGLGSEEWPRPRPRRQQTAVEVVVGPCCDQPPRRHALCVVRASDDCRPDHGAPLVSEGQLLAIASNQSLCNGTVLLVPPLREWITREVKLFTDGVDRSAGWGGDNGSRTAAGDRRRGSRSGAGPLMLSPGHGSLLMRLCVAMLPALLAWALS